MQPSAPSQPQVQYIDRVPEPKQPTYEESQASAKAAEQKLIDEQARAALENSNSAIAKTKKDTYVRTTPAASSNYLGS
jgi:hypothetical protein